MRASLVQLVRILPRSAVPKPSIVPTVNMASPAAKLGAAGPSLIKELGQRQELGQQNGTWPGNLRIETFEDAKSDWVGYTKDIRRGLKKFAKEH